MRRDDDYLRELMLELETSADSRIAISQAINMSGEDEKKSYHAELLCDTGFFYETGSGVYRLTNQGHDYLDAVRDENIWDKTKEAAQSVGGVTLGVMKDLAIAILKQKLKEKTGFDI